MIPEPFEYFTPDSVQEATALARRYGEDAKFLSGGHSLLPMMKLRLASPRYVIDLAGIRELTQISQQDGKLKVGALVTHHTIERDQLLLASCRLLVQTAAEIGDAQVRNRGTIGGAVAHADPASDYPAALLALDAEIEVEGEGGRRRIAAEKFFIDLFATALEPGELLVAVHLPVLGPDVGTSYQKLRQQASGFAVTGAAALVGRDEAGKCTRIAVAINGVATRAFRVRSVEQLVGKTITARAIDSTCRGVAANVEAHGDLYASAGYRKAMADVFARRALMAAASVSPRATGDGRPAGE